MGGFGIKRLFLILLWLLIFGLNYYLFEAGAERFYFPNEETVMEELFSPQGIEKAGKPALSYCMNSVDFRTRLFLRLKKNSGSIFTEDGINPVVFGGALSVLSGCDPEGLCPFLLELDKKCLAVLKDNSTFRKDSVKAYTVIAALRAAKANAECPHQVGTVYEERIPAEISKNLSKAYLDFKEINGFPPGENGDNGSLLIMTAFFFINVAALAGSVFLRKKRLLESNVGIFILSNLLFIPANYIRDIISEKLGMPESGLSPSADAFTVFRLYWDFLIFWVFFFSFFQIVRHLKSGIANYSKAR
ncbi:MAG: hypothetical protein ACLFQK_05720 [Fibrobacterota bacterium]